MTHHKSNSIAVMAAASLSLGLVLTTPSAWGQTATDLICSGCVQGTDIENGTIGPNKLIPGSINATTIANGVIGPNKLIPGSINTATIANDAIRSNKILDGAVKSADIGDGEVTSADIQDGSITGADIQNGSITSVDIGLDTITRAQIGPNAVGFSEIIANAVRAEEIADDAVGSSEIAANAVGFSEMADNAVSTAEAFNLFDVDLSDEAGLDFNQGGTFVSFLPADGSDRVVRTVTLTAPTSGFAVASVSAQLFRPATTAGTSIGLCTVTQGLSSGIDVIAVDLNQDIRRVSIGRTLGFSINAGSNIFRLICRQSVDGGLQIARSAITAIFVPTRY